MRIVQRVVPWSILLTSLVSFHYVDLPRGTNPCIDASSFAALGPAVRQAGADESWWQTVTASLAREEYHASPAARGVQASNRAHNLRTYFGEESIEIVPREGGEAPAWSFSWETARFGREDALRAVEPAAPEADGARVVYRRPGFIEWYENSAAGLEQGFTVTAPPPGEGSLCIAGRITGSLRAELRDPEGAVDLLDDHEARALRYGELNVRDADGDEVPSRLNLEGTELAILVDDRGATYPLTVDPLMTSPAWTAESDQVGAAFGFSVATAGDVNGDGFSDVIVGAVGYDNGQDAEGWAFVYHGSASGLATTPAWTAESNQAEAFFGGSVATAGDVNGDGFSDVIVGAAGYDNGQDREGRAFVYHGSAAGLVTTPAWTAESNQANADFGRSVATAGDVNGDGFSAVIIGAWQYDNGETNEGRAFVYHGSAGGLATTPAWTAESNQANAYFGFSVATAGDVNGDGFSDVIVGANHYDNGQSDEGRAFVYHGSATGLATTPAWTAESQQLSATFGGSVATAGDVNGDGFSDVIVGANYYDNGETDEGRAFVYEGSAAGLAATPAWTAESNQAIAEFGFSVATAGDVNGDGFSDVIVGAWRYSNGQFSEGRAFVYHGDARTSVPAPDPRADLARIHMGSCFPNPFHGSTTIDYATPGSGSVRVSVFDLRGRRLAVLVEETQSSGGHSVSWNGRDEEGEEVPPGLYLVRLESAGEEHFRKTVVAR